MVVSLSHHYGHREIGPLGPRSGAQGPIGQYRAISPINGPITVVQGPWGPDPGPRAQIRGFGHSGRQNQGFLAWDPLFGVPRAQGGVPGGPQGHKLNPWEKGHFWGSRAWDPIAIVVKGVILGP